MTEKQTKESNDDSQKQKKPRGMGGVVLILTMLMVLFLIVSRAGVETHSSVDALYSHLLNGRVERLVLGTEGTATAEIRIEAGRTRTLEVVVRGLEDTKLFHQLATLKLDATEYPATLADPIGAFLQDVESAKARVLQAY
ncbi:MAG: hypothetical protein ABL997_20855, partial [Planctomycetota bacterium]